MTGLMLGVACSLTVCLAVATQSLTLGSNEGGWVYRFIEPFSWRPLVMAVLVALLSSAGIVVLEREVEKREWLAVLVWLTLALAFQGLLRTLTPFSLAQMFASSGANSFYDVTQQYSASAVLRNFLRLRRAWPLHAQSNMPGKLMMLYALELVSNRPAVLAWLVVLLSNAGGVFMYLFVRDLFDERRTAWYALVLYTFVPSTLFFFPLFNTVTPVFILASAWLCVRWLKTGRSGYATALGLVLFLQVFFEPLPLVLGLLFLALLARAVSLGDRSATTLLWQTGLGVVAFAAAAELLFLLFRFELFRVFRRLGVEAVAFNEEAHRPYGIWIRQNLVDFAFAIGACQAVLYIAAIIDGFLRSRAKRPMIDDAIVVCGLSLVGVLAAVDLLGVNRGEVVRLWIFLACFFQIPAAYACARLGDRTAIICVVATTVLQSALSTAMIGFVLP